MAPSTSTTKSTSTQSVNGGDIRVPEAGLRRVESWLTRPIDPAGLVAFRVLFGLLMCGGLLRSLLSGWVDRFYGQRDFFFKYWGASWIEPMPVELMSAFYVALALLALCVSLGLFYRASALLFFVGFTYVELIDVTNYLNHYYLVSLLALLLLFLPLGRVGSLDNLRRPGDRLASVPAWCLYLLRFQVGVVYVHAGLAKFGSDWLLHAQPLNLWLTARVDTPLIGPMLDEAWVAYAASWAGFLFDTTIVLWLSWRRTRPAAYLALLGFHFMTHVFFDIGMFPFLMSTAALVFFSPSWPRRPLALLGRLIHRPLAAHVPEPRAPKRWLRAGLSIAAAYCLFQALFPLRHLLYPGNVLWDEQGMRWAWKVMVREKHGSVSYRVRFRESGKELQVSPRRYLDARQEREMAGQPDLIAQLARHIARDFERRGRGPVEVRAEALVSLNGRPAQPMIDPARDLSRAASSLAPADWILPGPEGPPIRLRPRSGAGRDARAENH
jgi:vitamin K-dependent gamma-carboxylase